jgi:hypothetical protein
LSTKATLACEEMLEREENTWTAQVRRWASVSAMEAPDASEATRQQPYGYCCQSQFWHRWPSRWRWRAEQRPSAESSKVR